MDDALALIMKLYPGMDQVLLDGRGRVQPFIRVFINGRDTVDIEKALGMQLSSGDRLDIFPAIAGGSLLADHVHFLMSRFKGF